MKKLKDIFKIKFVQDIGSLQISTIVIAAFSMITSLIIAKKLKPTDFGIYGLALSLYGLVGMFGNIGVKQTALIKLSSLYTGENKERILPVLAYYFKVSLFIGILIMIIGTIIAPSLSQLLYHRQDIGRLSRIFFLMPPLIILYKLVAVLLEGTRNMRHLVIAECGSAFVNSLVLITLASLSLGLTVLIYGWLFSAIISSILAVFIYRNVSSVSKGLPSISEIVKKSYLVDSRQFLRFNMSLGFSENVRNLNDTLPIILTGIFVLPRDVGYFKLGYGALGLSMLFLEPIARNLLVKLSQSQSTRDIKELSKTFCKASLYAGIGSVVLVIAIIVVYHFLIHFFLNDYKESIKIIYPLAIYFCLIGFGIGLSPILQTLGRLDIEIKINVIGILIFIASSLFLVKNLGILGMAVALVISSLFTKFITYLSVKRLLSA